MGKRKGQAKIGEKSKNGEILSIFAGETQGARGHLMEDLGHEERKGLGDINKDREIIPGLRNSMSKAAKA